MSREIRLTKGFVAIVDDHDYAELSQYTWHWQSPDYATRTENGKTIAMHRQILNSPKGVKTDHINGHGLDNRCRNIRVCTHAQNMRNVGPKAGRRFKGTKKRCRRFWAEICVDGRCIQLGKFDTEEEAARAYDVAAVQYHGLFASVELSPQRQRDDLSVVPPVTDELRLREFFAVRRDWSFITQEPSRVAA